MTYRKKNEKIINRSQQQHGLRPSGTGHHQQQQQQHTLDGIGGLETRQSQASTFKLTRGRSAAARYLRTTTTTTTTTHYQQPAPPGFGPPPPLAPRHLRPGVRPSAHRHFGPRSYSYETQEEVQEEDEATLRELLLRSDRYFPPLCPTDNQQRDIYFLSRFANDQKPGLLALSIQFYIITSLQYLLAARSFGFYFQQDRKFIFNLFHWRFSMQKPIKFSKRIFFSNSALN